MLRGILPAPKHTYQNFQDHDEGGSEQDASAQTSSRISNGKTIPAYPNRKGFVPLNEEHFADGGAYPEIHVVQYPRNMAKPGARKSSALVPVQVDETGKLRTDMIVRQGSNRDKLVQSQMSDIKEKAVDVDKIALPEEEEVMDTAERTKLALESLIDGKIKSSKGTTVPNPADREEPAFIRYAPNPSAPGYNPAAKQRVIKMVEAQLDPMEPPKHKHTKAPRGPPSPPVPVLHSPPRKLTVEDQQAWKIPPCVSNWKNARGFIIPLDKRVAADGRSLQEVTINNKFAMVSEALFVAERKATEDLKIRNDIRKKMALKEKEEREQALRDMANRARLERAGLRPDVGPGAVGGGMDFGGGVGGGSSSSGGGAGRGTAATAVADGIYGPGLGGVVGGGGYGGGIGRAGLDDDDEALRRRRERFMAERGAEGDSANDDDRSHGRGGGGSRRRGSGGGDDRDGSDGDSSDVEGFAGETEDEKIARQQRERLRMERRKERERELRIENMKGNMRKNKVDRDEGRDISEKIALGMLRGTGGKVSGEAMYDSRLFNQSSGMDAGFGAEDEYNTYSRPLFDRAEAGSIYRPRQGADDVYGDADQQMAKLSDTSRFRADKGFKGAEGRSDAGPRDAPVQFEKGGNKGSDDPFGIGDIVDHRRDSGGGGPSSSSRGRDRDSRGDRDSSDRKRSRRD